MQSRFYSNFSLVLLLSITLFSCANPGDGNRQGNKMQQNYQHTFTSVGYAPIAAQQGDTFDLQILNAIKASKLEAYKELAEQVYGVLLNAESNVNGARIQKDLIHSRVKGLVRGAKVLKSYHEGDMYITELELDMQTLPFLGVPEFNGEGTRVIHVEKQIYY